MFLFRISRRPARLVPQAAPSHASLAAWVTGLDYYDAEAEDPRGEAGPNLSPEGAALDQAFGYWSET